MRLRRLVYVGSLVLLLFCIQETSPTLMLTSLLMSGGLLVKMSLGGLMMMLNAASNENKQGLARQNNLFAASSKSPTPFDILSLMSTSHSNNNIQVATSATPTKVTPNPTSPMRMTTGPANKLAKRRVIRKRIKVKRDVDDVNEIISTNENKTSNTTANVDDVNELISTNENKTSNTTTKEGSELPLPPQDEEVQRRLYRQITNLDPLMCLPKVMCGINSAPPSTKTTILNDYAYLMKTIFQRDDDDDKKKPVVNDDNVTTKKKETKKKTSNRNDEGADDDDTAEEEFALNDEDFDRLALKEEEDIEALANDEMVDEEPGFLPFIMKDVHLNSQKHKIDHSDYPMDDLHHNGQDYGEDEYSHPHHYQMSGRPQQRPPPHMVHQNPPEADKTEKTGSILSYLPKFSFGKNKEGNKDAFSSDPFFEGFKRSMKSNENETTITKEQEEILKNIAIKREKRNAYINRKKKQIEMSNDPSEKFKIAAEIGKKLKSPRQCRAVFNNCPFQYTEVLSMINNLRKAIQGIPEVAASNTVETVVIPKEAPPVQVQPVQLQSIVPVPVAVAPSKNIINVATGNTGHGITSISHQLPNGETVEINLKLMGQPSTTTETTTTSTSTSTTTLPTTIRVEPAKVIKVIRRPQFSRPQFSRPNDKEKVFPDDDERIFTVAAAQPYDAATYASMRDRINSIESLESLKATILAIEKINNATINRKKYGKPITYDGVFHEVTGLSPPKPKKRPQKPKEHVHDGVGSSESTEDDEFDEDLPIVDYSNVKITIKPPETKKPNRLRPQIDNEPQIRLRPKRPTEQLITSPLLANPPKRVIKYKTRKPTGSGQTSDGPAVSKSKNNTTNKNTKISQNENPVNIVPFTEKENVVNPGKPTPPTASTDKKPSGKDKDKDEDYEEGDVDGDENDNDTSEEEEEDEENDGDNEERQNLQKNQNDSHDDDEEAEESTEHRLVIKPSGHVPPPPQMQGPHPPRHPHPHGPPHQQLPGPHPDRHPHPHGPPPQQMQGPHPDRHPHGRPPQPMQGPHPERHPPHGPPPQQMQGPHPERHPHGPPPQQMQGPHSERHPHGRPHGPPPQMPGRRPQRHAHIPHSKFIRRTFYVPRGRGRSIDNEESTSTEKPHPNHRYPCGVDATTTEKNNDQNSQEIQPPETTTSTQPPPVLPFKYPKYASPHNKPNTE